MQHIDLSNADDQLLSIDVKELYPSLQTFPSHLASGLSVMEVLSWRLRGHHSVRASTVYINMLAVVLRFQAACYQEHGRHVATTKSVMQEVHQRPAKKCVAQHLELASGTNHSSATTQY